MFNNLATDKIKHLKVGVALAFAVLVLVLVHTQWGAPAAILAGGTGACYFTDWYQRARGNGTFEWSDIAWGSLPSWLLAAGVALAGHYRFNPFAF